MYGRWHYEIINKKYQLPLKQKQSTLDNYIKYLHTACELAKVDKVQVIEIVRNKNSYKKYESITKYTRLNYKKCLSMKSYHQMNELVTFNFPTQSLI